jgi:hypothetical protein
MNLLTLQRTTLLALVTACSGPVDHDPRFFDGTSGQAESEGFGTRSDALSVKADLVVSLSGTASAVPGGAGSYAISTGNVGGRNASQTQVVFTPPAGTSITSVDTGCTILNAPLRVRCSLSTLNAGASRTRNVGVTLPHQTGTVTFGVAASTTSAETSTSNNQASFTTTLAQPVYEPELSLPQALFAAACYPATDFSQCTPWSLVTADIVLLDGGVVDTQTPEVSGTYTQPNGPSSLHMEFRLVSDGSWLSTFTGQAISESCFRGTVSTASDPGGFEACLP